MNKGTFAKRLVLPVLAGVFVVGCTHQTSNAPVSDSRPVPTATTAVKPPPAVLPPVAQPGEHIVRQGETLYAVSRLYSVPVRDLIAWNNLSRPEQLDVGQVLRVAAPGVAAAEPFAMNPGLPLDMTNLPEVKREPRGGKEAWSEEAWARLQPQATGNTTMPRSEISAPGPAASVPGASEDWMWPVKGTIVSRFDEPMGGDGKVRNRGIDIAGAPGTPILAAADGRVAYAGDSVRGLGNMVIVKHNDEYLTAYAHNRVILVKEGEKVTKGQKIAELGDSDADRPKLHFELRKQGVPVDPLKYLPGL